MPVRRSIRFEPRRPRRSVRATLVAAAATVTLALPAAAGAQPLDAAVTTWLPNAPATAIAPGAGDLVYLAGDFTRVGRRPVAACRSTRGRASPSRRSRRSTHPCARSSRTAPAAGSSPATSRRSAARRAPASPTSRPTAPLDATWNPAPDGAVDELVRSGSTVYARGSFTTIGGVARQRLAALDATTGAATAWNPAPDDAVTALAATGSTIYVAGAFGTIAGEARQGLAALDATTGAATRRGPPSSTAT